MSDTEQAFSRAAGAVRLEEEITAVDADFTFVRIAEFYSPRKTSFDLFLKLGAGRYLRVFRAGDTFDESELKAYELDRGVRHVYFARAHRAAYVASSSLLLQKITPLPAVPLRTKFGVARILSELYVQELLEATDGTRRKLVDKGRDLCAALAAWVDTQAGLERFFLHLDQVDANPAALSFLTGILSCLLSHRMPWKSRRTTEALLFASFLCDVGLAELPPEVQRLKPKRMSAQQKRQFEKHPEISYLLLADTKSPALTDNILHIVRQHHEYCDGSGYPAGLPADKTLQLAKVVVLCGDLVRASSDYLLPPKDAARILFPELTEKLLQDRPELVAKYDKELLPPLFKLLLEGGAGA
jgi:HD-GYP domain-containing protein (c-di-GMP phosphodiesterase class II)